MGKRTDEQLCAPVVILAAVCWEQKRWPGTRVLAAAIEHCLKCWNLSASVTAFVSGQERPEHVQSALNSSNEH